MFSEYASRFLAQSQSRLLGGQENAEPSQHPSRPSRHGGPNQAASRYQTSRSYLQRPNMPNPYGPSASQISRFPFASRTSAAPAPLFYSVTDDFREEDDGLEHEREVADFYALQKSRRQFGGSHLTDSSDMDDRDHASKSENSHGDEDDSEGPAFGRGIRSSWRGSRMTVRGREPTVQPIQEADGRERSVGASEASAPSSKGKGKLVDVELASTDRGSADELQEDFSDDDNDPPPTQHFRRTPGINPPRNPLRNTLPIPLETDEETLLQNPRPASPDQETVLTIIPEEQEERYDSFWSYLYLIWFASFMGTAFLVWVHTTAPDKKLPLGDTIYSTLHSSFHLLSVYTLVSMIVAALWLACLAYFARPLVQLITLSVPIILVSFFLYPFISSYKGKGETTLQDKVMRWASFVPGVCAILWIYMVYQGRRSIDKATRILELASKVLTDCPALVLVGIAVLTTTVLWTWMWIGLFTRLFLEGHVKRRDGKVTLWVIDLSTWWLGVFYILFYLWTSSVIAGIQRSLTSATVSQWYFHRRVEPKPTSRQVAEASFWHAVGPMFGSICLSTFLTIALRLPLMVLPRRFAAFVSLCVYQFIPTSAVMLTNPLTLTYASIHSMELRRAAHGLRQLSFVSHSTPTTTLTPRSFSSPSGHELVPYRLSKLLLHATRFVMSLALGFGGWVNTARTLELAGSTRQGSLYAYVVGMVAAAIGWGILGAFEGVMGFVLDALIVCWGSEVGSQGTGWSHYCEDAGLLFGDSTRRYA